MKKVLVLLMVMIVSSLSTQVYASADSRAVTQFTAGTSVSPFLVTLMSSGYNLSKEANQIMADGQEYSLTGELTPFLESNVNGLQEQSDLSTDEAVIVLMEKAAEILKQ